MGRFDDLYKTLSLNPDLIPQLKQGTGKERRIPEDKWLPSSDLSGNPMDILERAALEKDIKNASAMANVSGINNIIRDAIPKALDKTKSFIKGMGKNIPDEIKEDAVSQFNKAAWQREMQENLYDKQLNEWIKSGRKGPAPSPAFGSSDAFVPERLKVPEVIQRPIKIEDPRKISDSNYQALKKANEIRMNTPIDSLDKTIITESEMPSRFNELGKYYKGNK
jgi:hypothetical protein